MNKILRNLLIAALAVSANASAYTNKTHMQLRNQALRNLPLEQTTTKERTVAKLEDRFGGTLSVTGFYGQTTNAKEAGKYFGCNNKNEVKLGAATDDLSIANVVGAGTTDATVKFDPEVISYGVNLGYYQDLSKIINGLNLKVSVPVERVENDLKMKVSGTDKDKVVTYFKGGAVTGQEALKYAKIDGKCSTTGVANVDVQLGYRFLDKEAYNAGLNIGVVVPTGKELKGVYAFEPQVGSNHWGLGAGLDAQARVWGGDEHNVKLNFATNYRYMFEATEKRTLGLKDVNWAQYHRNNAATSVPVANLLTLDVNATPGSQLDSILGLAYNNGGFAADLGYNMYFAEQESVKTKGVITNPTLSGAATAATVDATAAETPAQFTHSIYGGLGYATKTWEYPVMVGLGGKYEMASRNSAMDGWQGWAKLGLSF